MPAFRNVPSFAQKTKNVEIQKKTALWVVFFSDCDRFFAEGRFFDKFIFQYAIIFLQEVKE